MKRLILALTISTMILTGCGNPSVVAYTRGMVCQREAETAQTEAGKVNNKVEAKYFQAIEQFNSALHFDPNLTDAYYRRGVCREAISQFDAALDDYTQATHLKPQEAEYWRRKGNAEMMLQKYADAVADYNAADNLAPDQIPVLYKRAYCEIYSDQPKAALADAKKLAENVADASSYCLLAAAERANGHIKEMDQAFEKALEAEPHQMETYQNRALAEMTLGRYKAALKDFKTVAHGTEFTGSDAPYAVLLGALAAKLDKNEPEAKGLLDEAVSAMRLPTEIDKNAHNAQVSNDWPLPGVQWLHGDITQDKFIRAAQGDSGKETELACYLGLIALSKGDKKTAKSQFKWVLENGRRDYVEWSIAQRLSHTL